MNSQEFCIYFYVFRCNFQKIQKFNLFSWVCKTMEIAQSGKTKVCAKSVFKKRSVRGEGDGGENRTKLLLIKIVAVISDGAAASAA